MAELTLSLLQNSESRTGSGSSFSHKGSPMPTAPSRQQPAEKAKEAEGTRQPFQARQRERAQAEVEDDEEDEPAQHRGRIIAMPNGIVVRIYGTHYGDLKIICTFPGDIQKEMIIDVTVAGTHAVSNHSRTIDAGKYSAGLADHKADGKDKKHEHYLHGNAIGFALDSMGGISKAAMDFTNLMYAKGQDDRKVDGTERA
jgi:hypothetical protein